MKGIKYISTTCLLAISSLTAQAQSMTVKVDNTEYKAQKIDFADTQLHVWESGKTASTAIAYGNHSDNQSCTKTLELAIYGSKFNINPSEEKPEADQNGYIMAGAKRRVAAAAASADDDDTKYTCDQTKETALVVGGTAFRVSEHPSLTLETGGDGALVYKVRFDGGDNDSSNDVIYARPYSETVQVVVPHYYMFDTSAEWHWYVDEDGGAHADHQYVCQYSGCSDSYNKYDKYAQLTYNNIYKVASCTSCGLANFTATIKDTEYSNTSDFIFPAHELGNASGGVCPTCHKNIVAQGDVPNAAGEQYAIHWQVVKDGDYQYLEVMGDGAVPASYANGTPWKDYTFIGTRIYAGITEVGAAMSSKLYFMEGSNYSLSNCNVTVPIFVSGGTLFVKGNVQFTSELKVTDGILFIDKDASLTSNSLKLSGGKCFNHGTLSIAGDITSDWMSGQDATMPKIGNHGTITCTKLDGTASFYNKGTVTGTNQMNTATCHTEHIVANGIFYGISEAATCTKAIGNDYYCSNCGEMYLQSAPNEKPLGHDYAIRNLTLKDGKYNEGTYSLVCQREGCTEHVDNKSIGVLATTRITLLETKTAPDCTNNGSGSFKFESYVEQAETQMGNKWLETTYDAAIPAVADAHVYELVNGSYQCKYHNSVKAVATLTYYNEDGSISSVVAYETTAAAIDDAMNGYGSNPRTLNLYENVTATKDYSNYYKSYPLTINLNGCTWDGYYKEFDLYYQADIEGYRSLSTGMPITIKNGTFKASFNNSEYNKSELIFDNATIYTNQISWCSTGAVALKNGATLNISNQFSFSKITIDASSILNLDKVTTLGGNNNVSGGFADLVHRMGSHNIPEGYTFKVDDYGSIYFYDANGDAANSDITMQVKGSDTMSAHSYTGLYKEEMLNYDPEDEYAWAYPHYQVCDMCALTNKELHPILPDLNTEDSNNNDGFAYTCDEYTLTDAHDYKIGVNFTATKLKYNRAVTGGQLVTVCLPAALPADKVNGEVFTLTGYNQSTGKLALKSFSGTNLEAGVPYAVNVNDDATQLFSQSSFDNVKVKATDDDLSTEIRDAEGSLMAELYGMYASGKANDFYYAQPCKIGADNELVAMEQDDIVPAYTAFFSVRKHVLPAEGVTLSLRFVDPDWDISDDGTILYKYNGSNRFVYVPDGVETIKNGAFPTFSNMRIYLPSSIKYLEKKALYYPDRIYLKSLPKVENGVLFPTYSTTIELDDDSYIFNTNEFINYAAWDIITFTYSRSMTNKWGTIVVPFNVASGYDYDIFTISGVSDTELTLTKVDKLPCGTPALIRMSESAKNEETGKYELVLSSASNHKRNDEICNYVNTPDPVDGYTLTGTFTAQEITDKSGYIIANNAFWDIDDVKGTNKVYNAPFRAYIACDAPNAAKMLTINDDDDDNDNDDATGINQLTTSSPLGELEGTLIYNLNGQRLNAPQKGINIINGKKVLVK